MRGTPRRCIQDAGLEPPRVAGRSELSGHDCPHQLLCHRYLGRIAGRGRGVGDGYVEEEARPHLHGRRRRLGWLNARRPGWRGAGRLTRQRANVSCGCSAHPARERHRAFYRSKAPAVGVGVLGGDDGALRLMIGMKPMCVAAGRAVQFAVPDPPAEPLRTGARTAVSRGRCGFRIVMRRVSEG